MVQPEAKTPQQNSSLLQVNWWNIRDNFKWDVVLYATFAWCIGVNMLLWWGLARLGLDAIIRDWVTFVWGAIYTGVSWWAVSKVLPRVTHEWAPRWLRPR